MLRKTHCNEALKREIVYDPPLALSPACAGADQQEGHHAGAMHPVTRADPSPDQAMITKTCIGA
jgi:hypothetical protein